MSSPPVPEIFPLGPNEWVPNNGLTPALVYRVAVAPDAPNIAGRLEALFQQHGWPPQWRDVVWRYHHYHPNAHEALGVSAGSATLVLGGPGGPEITVEPGDVLVIPAGVGHCCVTSSADFEVVGAYPPGQAAFDTCTTSPSTAQQERLSKIKPYQVDPVTGDDGTL